jgi:hypothetical protein
MATDPLENEILPLIHRRISSVCSTADGCFQHSDPDVFRANHIDPAGCRWLRQVDIEAAAVTWDSPWDGFAIF